MILQVKPNERGIGHPMTLVLIIVVLAAVGSGGYYVWSKNKDNSNNSAIVSDEAVESACAKELDDKDFCNFVSNWSSLSNYTMTITSTSAQGVSVFKVEAENADRSRTTGTQDGKETSSFVSIGNTTYSKDYSDGKWTKFTSETPSTSSTDVTGDAIFDLSNSATVDALSKIKYNKIGKEACDNLTCFKYQIVDPDNSTTEQFLWFDTEDFLLRRQTTKTTDSTTDMTLTYDKVSVTEPSPVKESSSLEL